MKTIRVQGINIIISDEYKKYTRDALISLYWHAHPRYNFFKNCKKNSTFFDIGASDGELSLWKKWESPLRVDIQMHGIDLVVGKFNKNYVSFKVLNLDESEFPYDDNFFDVMFSTHVIEHLKIPTKLAKNAYKKLKSGGTIFIESPTKVTLLMPSRDAFIEAGFNLSTMNFFDDKTHIRPYDVSDLINIFGQDCGFKILQSGIIVNDFLSDLLISYGYENNDSETTTYGLWLKFGWSNYIIAEKI